MFRFNLQLTIQSISKLFDFHNCSEMDCIRICSLLYMADRNLIFQTGLPITGDSAISMKYGPILENTYKYMNGELNSEEWSKHFKKVGYKLVRVLKASDDFLCPLFEDLLLDLTNSFISCNGFDLSEVTLKYPEWKLDCPITTEKIFECLGIESQLEFVRKEISAIYVFDDILSSVNQK